MMTMMMMMPKFLKIPRYNNIIRIILIGSIIITCFHMIHNTATIIDTTNTNTYDYDNNYTEQQQQQQQQQQPSSSSMTSSSSSIMTTTNNLIPSRTTTTTTTTTIRATTNNYMTPPPSPPPSSSIIMTINNESSKEIENENANPTTTSNSNSNNIISKKKKKKKKKKFILIHIGPSKTGTTSIQQHSGINEGFIKSLDKDKVLYVGISAGPEKREPFMNSFACSIMKIMKMNYNTNTTRNTIADNANATERQQQRQEQREVMINKCWINNSNDKYMLEDLSIVLSDETHSYNMEKYLDKIESYYKIFIDYLQYDEIIIVGAYRRYYDWLQSAYKENTRKRCLSYNLIPERIDTSRKNACISIWKFFINNHILKDNHYNTRAYHNIHETLSIAREMLNNASSTKTTITTSAAAIDDNNNAYYQNQNNNQKGRVEILNYFQLKQPNEQYYYNTITTELYCTVLGNDYTPNTCRYSKNKLSGADSHHHKGSTDNIPYKLIINEAQNRNWITGFPLSGRRYTSSNFNKTAVTSTSNISTWEDLQEYHHTQIIKQQQQQQQQQQQGTNKVNSNNNNALLLFPLICPSKKEMKTLLDKSLEFEKLVMPAFYENKILGKTKHINDFWKNLVQTNDLCSIDINTYFGNAKTWEEVLYERMTIITNSSWLVRVDKGGKKPRKNKNTKIKQQ